MAYTQQMRVQLPNGAPGRNSSKVEPAIDNREVLFSADGIEAHATALPHMQVDVATEQGRGGTKKQLLIEDEAVFTQISFAAFDAREIADVL